MEENMIEEFKKQIKAAIEEEAADAEKYMKMADMAGAEYASILRDIAREELSHKKLLTEIHADMEKDQAK